MTPEGYSEAVYTAVQNGTDIKAALERLGEILKRHGHEALYPRILQSLKARFAQDMLRGTATVRLAKDADEKKYTKEIGAFLESQKLSASEIVVDETLIGGYVFEGGGSRVDASYKKSLLNIYKNLIA